MQRLKLTFVAYRVLGLQYSSRNPLISKYLQPSGIHCKSFSRSIRTCSFSPHLSFENHFTPSKCVARYKHSSSPDKNAEENSPQEAEEPPEKLSLFKRYKKMLKEYWYVLIPVHMVTSAVWFGGFYYAASRGIDIVPFLEYISLPEALIEPLRSSSLGYIAVASAFYKLATPARYMVTLGGTTFTVKFLTKRGLIRPVPSKAEIKTILKKKLKKDGTSEEK